MKNLACIVFTFLVLLLQNARSQSPCNPGNSPTFQLATNAVTPAVNGTCAVLINLINLTSGTPGGGVTYSFVAPGQPTNAPSPPGPCYVPGIWTIVVYDLQNACYVTQTVQINLPVAPSISVVTSPTLVCSAQTTTLLASGATNYKWHTGSTLTAIPVNAANSFTYSVIGYNASGCAALNSGTINVMPSPSPTLTPSRSAICSNETVQITATGAVNYTWNASATGSILPVPQFTTMGANNYVIVLQALGNNGCVSLTSTYVTFTVSTCDGIQEENRTVPSLHVFPQPAESELNIVLTTSNEQAVIRLINTTGQVVFEKRLVSPGEKITLSVGDLSPGIYQVQLLTDEGIFTRSMMKN